MSTVVKDLGAVSAYAYAVEKGYTGTEAEFAELMADYAEVGQRAEDAADSALESKIAAETAATTATNKASEATTAAQTATTKAGEASTSASTATSAKDTAVSAASTATTKATEATTAAATAVSAKDDAVSANTAAQSAKTAAQTAQTGAETAAASVSASAEQIATNAEDISQLKSEFTALVFEEALNVESGKSNIFPCAFEAGETYIISTNKWQTGLRTLASDKTTTVDSIITEFTANTSVKFVPTADAPYLRVWGASNGVITVECTSKVIPTLEAEISGFNDKFYTISTLYTDRSAVLENMVNNHNLSANTYFQCRIVGVNVGDRLYIIVKTDITDETQAYNIQCRNYNNGASNVVRSKYIGDGTFIIIYDVIDANNLQLLVWPSTNCTLYGVSCGIGGVYNGNIIYVDGTNGDDNSDGLDELFAKKTITSALESGNNIAVKVGIYEENIKINNRANVRIAKLAKSSSSSDANFKNENRVIIRNPQTKLTFVTGTGGLYECEHTFDADSNMYKVFVSKSLVPIADAGGMGANAFNATIFKYDGTHNSKALKPVLTLAECQNEAETFFYDGTKIYLNTASFSGYEYMTAVSNKGALVANKCDALELSGIQFEMGYGTEVYLVGVTDSHACKITDCVGLLCAASTNFKAIRSDIDFVKCQSYRSATDGFAPIVSGTCNFLDCIGAYNKDDGVSHHQATSGIIDGGEYHHNGKGGVASPTHGAHVDIYNVYAHDNGVGIYAVAGNDVPTMPIKLFNNVVNNNYQAVAISNYTVYGYNNKFAGNTSDGNVNAITNL